MRKILKHATAMVLVLCLTAAITILPVRAEVSNRTLYNFDYYEATGSTPDASLEWLVGTEGEPLAQATTISEQYASGDLNWKYHSGYYTYDNVQKSRFNPKGYTEKNKTTLDGYLLVRAKVGDWIAFTIKNPGAGTPQNLTVGHVGYNYGAKACDVYILPGDTADIANALKTAEKIGTYNCYNANEGTGDCPAVETSYTPIGQWTPGDAEEYILVLYAAEAETGKAPWAYMYLADLAMDAAAFASVNVNGVTSVCETMDDAVNAINSATTGTVKLLANISSTTPINVASDVTLDLNGKTLEATVTGTGTVTDSSVGSTGKIVGQSVVQNVGAGELALYDGTTTRIVNYTLTPNETTSASDAVKFWYTFKFENAEAYKMIAEADNNAGFDVGATLTYGEGTVPASLQDGTIAGWAGEMAKDPNAGFAFYVAVTGFENLDANVTGNLDVKLTVEGSAGTAESAVVSYTIG